MEPVDPAAITGPDGGDSLSRSASASIMALRWAAGLERSMADSTSGHWRVTMSRNSSVTCHQPASSPSTRSASRAQSAPSVSTSSMSAAKSRASHSASAAEAGTTTSSANFAATWAGRRRFQAWTSGASSSSRSNSPTGGAWSSADGPPENSATSSSNSPSGRMTGRMADATAEHVDEGGAQRPRGAARRHVDGDVGQRQGVAVVAEARHQPPLPQRLGERRQEGDAGRNGEEPAAVAPRHRPGVPKRATASSAAAIASGVPTVTQWPPILTPNSRPASMAASK